MLILIVGARLFYLAHHADGVLIGYCPGGRLDMHTRIQDRRLAETNAFANPIEKETGKIAYTNTETTK